jgi:hypothetical protein
LHSDQRDVCRVAEHGGDTAGRKTTQGTLPERQFASIGFYLVGKRPEKTETRSCVRHLANETGRQAAIQALRTLFAHDVGTELERVLCLDKQVAPGLALKLDLNFHHVQRLDACSGEHTTHTNERKRFEWGKRILRHGACVASLFG